MSILLKYLADEVDNTLGLGSILKHKKEGKTVMRVDLSLIFQKPLLEKKVRLIIQPLAPLTMVSDIPGSYYKTLEIPDKHKLCGLFENILGWHFDKEDRINIHKKRKKEFKEKDYQINEANSGYQPLLFDYFDSELVFKSPTLQYNDLWKKAFSRLDAYVHANGTPNLDYEVLRIKPRNTDSKAIETFLKANKSKYPMYYTSPTLREYIVYDGLLQIGLKMSQKLFEELQKELLINSTAYLGNSEGWVEVNVEEIK